MSWRGPLPDGDDWSEAEIAEGERYAAEVSHLLIRVVDGLLAVPGQLEAEKRAVIEVTMLLDVAATHAFQVLGIERSELMISAMEVFEQVWKQGGGERQQH